MGASPGHGAVRDVLLIAVIDMMDVSLIAVIDMMDVSLIAVIDMMDVSLIAVIDMMDVSFSVSGLWEPPSWWPVSGGRSGASEGRTGKCRLCLVTLYLTCL